jgi:hypothetical protein
VPHRDAPPAVSRSLSFGGRKTGRKLQPRVLEHPETDRRNRGRRAERIADGPVDELSRDRVALAEIGKCRRIRQAQQLADADYIPSFLRQQHAAVP